MGILSRGTTLPVFGVRVAGGVGKGCELGNTIFSSPGRSPGRAIVLPPAVALAAAALAKSLTLKFFM